MLQDEGALKQEQDHYLLARAPEKACKMEMDDLHEWLQQEVISIITRADMLESIAKTSKIQSKIRAVHERAQAINLKELPDGVKGAETAIKAVYDRRYQHVLEAHSLLDREMIPLRNLAGELYRMRETLNLLETVDDDCDD